MNTGYTPVQGRGFVRPEKQNLQNFAEIIPVISGLIGGSETNIVNARALQMFDDDEKGVNLTYPPDGNQNMSIISESVFYKLIKTKSAPLPERPCEQLTCCEKIGSVQGNYINRVAKRHNCRITGKTKATRYGGPSTQATRYPQRMSIANNATFAAGGQCDQCAGLLVGYSYSLALRRWSSSRATATSCPISSAALTPIFSTCASASSEETRGFSPLPSAWRRAISPRTAVITKAAIVSPSVFEFSISSITSWGKRIFFICDLLLMFPVAIRMSGYFEVCTHYTKRCVNKTLDTVAHLNLICMHTNNCGVYTATPRSGGTHAGRLTTNDRKSIEVAMRNHTTHPQGRDSHDLNKYIWRFIALSTAQPRVITIEATSEQEARQQSPAGCVMVFAARIRHGVHHVQ
ncbi:host cell division inhibitor Icd-like protein [Escherichia coli]|nr:host cell division inhibitor Icd-like protein [Escherichia coli]EFA4305019.1 host cell division inhibitor Icd-like protein [Escherichia coli O19]EFH1599494.1 host cell division inhibitor Icd-like protein [Escherichia coli]EGJ2740946.1 host cell division inhibitor Icd-like protein [Escherichia coli]EHC2664239.1 host cell division inhibitor Icd-like protein [Escherichia coli]